MAARGSAVRRRERRMRSWWRHEQASVRMTLITACHHSFQRAHRVDQGAQVGAPWVHDFEMSEPSDDSTVIEYCTAPAPVIEHVSSTPAVPVIGYVTPETVEMVRFASHGQMQQQTVEHLPQNFTETVAIEHVSFTSDDTYAAPVPETEHVAPTSAVTFATLAPVIKDVVRAPAVAFHPVIEYVAPTPDVFHAAPASEIEHVALTPAVTYTGPAPVIEDAAPASAVICSTPAPETDSVTHSPVMEYIAPAPSVVFDTPSQMLPPAQIMAASIDATGVVCEPLRKKQCTVNQVP